MYEERLLCTVIDEIYHNAETATTVLGKADISEVSRYIDACQNKSRS